MIVRLNRSYPADLNETPLADGNSDPSKTHPKLPAFAHMADSHRTFVPYMSTVPSCLSLISYVHTVPTYRTFVPHTFHAAPSHHTPLPHVHTVHSYHAFILVVDATSGSERQPRFIPYIHTVHPYRGRYFQRKRAAADSDSDDDSDVSRGRRRTVPKRELARKEAAFKQLLKDMMDKREQAEPGVLQEVRRGTKKKSRKTVWSRSLWVVAIHNGMLGSVFPPFLGAACSGGTVNHPFVHSLVEREACVVLSLVFSFGAETGQKKKCGMIVGFLKRHGGSRCTKRDGVVPLFASTDYQLQSCTQS